MYVENLLDYAHCFLDGRVDENGIKRREHHKKGKELGRYRYESFVCQHHSSMINPNVK